jgi:hypothetical protein
MAGVFALLLLRFPGILAAEPLPNWDAVGHFAALREMAGYLASGHVTGYFGEWFGGMPLFQFYAPLFFVAVAGAWQALGQAVPLALLFRVASLLAVFAVVPALWFFTATFFGRREARFALALSPLYLFFPKVLASFGAGAAAAFYIGLVPNALGLALVLAWPAVLEQWRHAPRSRAWAAAAVLVPAVLALTHVLSFIFGLALVALWAAVACRDAATLHRNAVAGAVAFGLAAFWLVPMAATTGYAVGAVRLNSLAAQLLTLFPFHIWLMQPVAAAQLGLLAAGLALVWRRGQRVALAMYLGLLMLLLLQSPLTTLLPGLGVHYYRLLPLLMLLQLAFAAVALAAAWDRWSDGLPRFRLYATVAVATLVGITFFGVYANRLDNPEVIGPGIPWRAERFEDLAVSEELAARLARRGDVVRVSVEQPTAETLFRFGSQAALPSLLASHGLASTGGLYMESAPAYPLLSSADSQLLGGASVVNEVQSLRRLGPFAMQSPAVQLARLCSFGVNYYVTMTEPTRASLAALVGHDPVDQVGPFAVFRLGDSASISASAATTVALPAAFLSSYGRLRFRDVATALFAGEQTYSFPVAELRGDVRRLPPAELGRFSFFIVDGRSLTDAERADLVGLGKPVLALGGSGLGGTPGVPKFERLNLGPRGLADAWPAGWPELWSAMATLRDASGAGAAATVTRPDSRTLVVRSTAPAILHYTYFPYWQALGDAKVYRATSEQMLVFPGPDGTATLIYRPDGIARAAQAASWFTAAAFAVWLAWPLRRRRGPAPH